VRYRTEAQWGYGTINSSAPLCKQSGVPTDYLQRRCGIFSQRKIMKFLNKVAILLAAAGLVTVAGAQEIHNWRNASGEVWKNAYGECWRDASWTPATAAPGCDGAIAASPAPKAAAPAPAAPMAAAPAAAPAPAAPVAAAPVVVPVAAAAAKLTYAADALAKPSWMTWWQKSRVSTWKW
jgi:OOP family OmpA-OmpF porin